MAFKYALQSCLHLKTNVLFIDETLDVIDTDSFSKVEKMLELLNTVYPKIVIITHRDFICGKKITIFK